MRHFLFACLLSLVLTVPAFAAGFVGSGTDTSSPASAQAGNKMQYGKYRAVQVKEAAALPDDTHVVLEGHIVEKIHGKKHRYLFHDDSGTIPVKIKGKHFGQQEVTAQTPVRIFGEVDRDASQRPPKIDVDRLEIIK